MSAPSPPQSALMPVNLTTLPHFSVSSAMNFPKSEGEPVSGVVAVELRAFASLDTCRQMYETQPLIHSPLACTRPQDEEGMGLLLPMRPRFSLLSSRWLAPRARSCTSIVRVIPSPANQLQYPHFTT